MTCKYMKDLRYRLNMDAIRHHQAAYLLLLNTKDHNYEIIKDIVGRNDDNLVEAQAALEFGRNKIIHRKTPVPQQSDQQKTKYLEILTQDQSFKSLDDILNRMRSIAST